MDIYSKQLCAKGRMLRSITKAPVHRRRSPQHFAFIHLGVHGGSGGGSGASCNKFWPNRMRHVQWNQRTASDRSHIVKLAKTMLDAASTRARPFWRGARAKRALVSGASQATYCQSYIILFTHFFFVRVIAVASAHRVMHESPQPQRLYASASSLRRPTGAGGPVEERKRDLYNIRNRSRTCAI